MMSPTGENATSKLVARETAARYSHHPRQARVCNHTLHPCSPRYPCCPQCTLSKARTRLAEVEIEIRSRGGVSPAADARNRAWCRARLVHGLAVRRMREAARRFEVQERQIREWEQAHEQADLANPFEDWAWDAESPCPVCLIKTLEASADSPDGSHWTAVDKDSAWWEKPNILASNPDTVPHRSISPWRRNRRQGKKPIKPRLSQQLKPSLMAEIILHRRIELSIQEAFEYGPNLYKIEQTFRRKFDCFSMQVDQRVWSMPHSFIRMRPAPMERIAHRPFRRVSSGLSTVEGVDEFEVSEETRRREEEERMRCEEMKARKQVGCLFLVGKSEGELVEELGAEFFMGFLRAGRNGGGDEDPGHRETGEDNSEAEEDKENEPFEEYYDLSSSEEEYEEEYSDEEYWEEE